jgi:hypothetical protein
LELAEAMQKLQIARSDKEREEATKSIGDVIEKL